MKDEEDHPNLLAALALLHIICSRSTKSTKLEMKLSPEDTVIFIRLIKKYQLLWNTKHPDYRNKEKQLNAWNKIATYFHAENGLEAYGKYRRLRSMYTNALTKIRQGKTSDPKLFYFKEMDFLRGSVEEHMQKKCTNEVLVKAIEPSSAPDKKANEKDGGYLLKEDRLKEERPVKSEMFNTKSFWQAEVFGSKNPNSKSHNENTAGDYMPGQPRTANTSTESLVTAKSHIDGPALTQAQSASLPQNEFEVFAVHIANQLRQMDTVYALQLMTDIQSMVSHKRIHLLKRHNPKRKSSHAVEINEAVTKITKFK